MRGFFIVEIKMRILNVAEQSLRIFQKKYRKCGRRNLMRPKFYSRLYQEWQKRNIRKSTEQIINMRQGDQKIHEKINHLKNGYLHHLITKNLISKNRLQNT